MLSGRVSEVSNTTYLSSLFEPMPASFKTNQKHLIASPRVLFEQYIYRIRGNHMIRKKFPTAIYRSICYSV